MAEGNNIYSFYDIKFYNFRRLHLTTQECGWNSCFYPKFYFHEILQLDFSNWIPSSNAFLCTTNQVFNEREKERERLNSTKPLIPTVSVALWVLVGVGHMNPSTPFFPLSLFTPSTWINSHFSLTHKSVSTLHGQTILGYSSSFFPPPPPLNGKIAYLKFKKENEISYTLRILRTLTKLYQIDLNFIILHYCYILSLVRWEKEGPFEVCFTRRCVLPGG